MQRGMTAACPRSMTSFRASTLVLLLFAVPARGEDAAVSPPVRADAPKAHELALTALGGGGITSHDYYDGGYDSLYVWGAGVEYAYRLSPHLRIGGEGSRISLQKQTGESDPTYGGLWTATPFVGLSWGHGTLQGGVRLGFGFAHGGRRSKNNVPDREGAGFDAQLLGELALCGSSFDLIGRFGLRYTRTSWDAPLAHLYPNDLPVGMAFLTLGGRWKL